MHLSADGAGSTPRTAASDATSSRPHRAARLEYAFDSRLAAFLQHRGWTARIEPYVGYGAPGWVRVLGRVVLAGPGVRDDDLPGAGSGATGGSTRPVTALRGWRSFAVVPLPFARVHAVVDGARSELVSDRGGYVDSVVSSGLAPGWRDVELVTATGRSATVPVVVIGADARFGVVSDIDDTVMITRLPRPFIAAWNTFVRHDNAREPVPGMADFYRRAFGAQGEVPVMYLSTGAWNAAPAIGRFLRRHRYPTGPLLLTDWGPTNSGWFRSGAEHKRAALRRLLTELPGIRWVLVGDDGQRDPQIYGEVAQQHPDRVLAVVIRQLSGTEQVLAHGAPAPTAGTASAQARTRSADVPLLQGADGAALLRVWTARRVDLE
ncbi:MAG: App1 family protein [Cellulomonas sp.]